MSNIDELIDKAQKYLEALEAQNKPDNRVTPRHIQWGLWGFMIGMLISSFINAIVR